MTKFIYIITKPSDLINRYVGSTSQTLSIRMTKHRCDKKRYPHKIVYQWYDESCKIDLIEIVEIQGTEKENRVSFEAIERLWMLKFRWAGYNILNSNYGKSKAESYHKDMCTKHNAKYKTSGKQKEWTKARASKAIKQRKNLQII